MPDRGTFGLSPPREEADKQHDSSNCKFVHFHILIVLITDFLTFQIEGLLLLCLELAEDISLGPVSLSVNGVIRIFISEDVRNWLRVVYGVPKFIECGIVESFFQNGQSLFVVIKIYDIGGLFADGSIFYRFDKLFLLIV